MSFPLFFLTTLGCKVNQYESQALREAWLGRGLVEAARPEDAGLILVNSCAVTAKALADVRGAVRRLHRAAPEAAIVITGCAAQVAAEDLLALPGVSRVVGQNAKAELLQPPGSGSSSALLPLRAAPEDARAGEPLPDLAETALNETAYPPFAVSGYARSRAVLKIQDGCSHGCTYCIVPLARGRARSRAFNEALQEAERLLDAGFREIVISGVNLRQYTLPEEGDAPRAGAFWRFLGRLDAALAPRWAGRARFRISSLEPGQLGAEALDTIAACRMLSPHLHLSLQSGSPSVLRRMGRGHYDPAALPDFLAALRSIYPVFGLGADILTAFPGESDEEHAEGLRLFASLPLTYAHVFPYSSRPGTRAAAMAGHLPPEVKKERAAGIRALIKDKKRAFLRALLTLPEVTVVFEQREDRQALRGVNEFYADCRLDPPRPERAPEKDQTGTNTRALLPPAPPTPGALSKVVPTGVAGETLRVALRDRREAS